MKFSLIMGTLGRTSEVLRFLASLDAQSHRDFELIVVDQNADERLASVLEPYASRFPISHMRSSPGLSHARNVGLRLVFGDVVAFPDDDCWYPPDLLARVTRGFSESPDCDGLTGRSVDENGKDSALDFGMRTVVVDRFNAWSNVISYTIFLRRAVVESNGPFDETLGVGAGTIFGSGEETDYILRAVGAGFRLSALPTMYVHHPDPDIVFNERVIRRAYAYGCGMGRVLSKHDFPLWYKGRALFRPFVACILSCARLNARGARFYWSRCAGRLRGMRYRDSAG